MVSVGMLVALYIGYMEDNMKKVNFIIIALIVIFTASCSTGSKSTSNTSQDVKVVFPGDGEMNEFISKHSIPLHTAKLVLPTNPVGTSAAIIDPLNNDSNPVIDPKPTPAPTPVVETEKCNEVDDDDDGLIDEGCYGCYENALVGDFDNDGKVTRFDCNLPLLYAYSKTTVANNTDCLDVDKDRQVGLGDMVLCLKIVKGLVDLPNSEPKDTTVIDSTSKAGTL